MGNNVSKENPVSIFGTEMEAAGFYETLVPSTKIRCVQYEKYYYTKALNIFNSAQNIYSVIYIWSMTPFTAIVGESLLPSGNESARISTANHDE
jgi:hypothetical protein